MKMAEPHPDDFRMSLGDHLEDLRRRIIYALLGPLLAAGVMLYFGPRLVALICQPMLYELQRRGLDPTLHTSAPTSAFSVYLTVSLISGLVIGIPWVVYQFWLFISPGLYRHERKFVVLLLPGSAALSTIGVLFMYYVMLPVTIWFLVGFNDKFELPDLSPTAVQQQIAEADDTGEPAIDLESAPGIGSLPMYDGDPPLVRDGDAWINRKTHNLRVVIGEKIYTVTMKPAGMMMTPVFMIDQYIRFVVWLALAFVIAFQLPLVMLLLGFTRLVTREQLARGRKWAVLVCVLVGAILTPPDPISQLSLALPLYVLFEFGLLLMRWFIKPRALTFEDAE
jgi:sec-independent protein translocase protein TatC